MKNHNFKIYQNGGADNKSDMSSNSTIDSSIKRYDEETKDKSNTKLSENVSVSSNDNEVIDSESSEKEDIEKELKIENIKKFSSINEIPEYLETVKKHYLNLKLDLDRHEISRLITKTLNVAILGSITTEEQIYSLFMKDYDEIKKKVIIIIDKIREFNKNNNYEYWVDLDKIVYLLWFKEFKFIKNLIISINENLEHQLNIIHLNSYLIGELYNDPKLTKYYLKILQMMINNEDDSNRMFYNDKLRQFFTIAKITKIDEFIRLIYTADKDFITFVNSAKEEKFSKEKENNDPSKTNNFNNIEDIEKKIKKEKKRILSNNEKRPLDLSILLKDNSSDDGSLKLNYKDIINNIDEDLWHSINLFLYKKFSFNMTDYIQQINKIRDKLPELQIDYFNDLEVPFIVRKNPDKDGDRGTELTGGNNTYFKKYLKYKEKYLQLQLQLNKLY